eukprot:2111008-Heterocapsa_arctica.AAC.1
MSGRMRGYEAVAQRLPCSREGCRPGTKGKYKDNICCSKHTLGQATHKVVGMEQSRKIALGLNKRQVFLWQEFRTASFNVRVLDEAGGAKHFSLWVKK